jgi:transcriptional regulator of acetoin/glycerol metabolism
LTDRLAREGLRVLGRPVGIDQAAYARLVDYPFPGEDAELAGVVQRLVAACAAAGRDVVRAEDVVSLELNFAAPTTSAESIAVGTEMSDGSGARLRKDPISA